MKIEARIVATRLDPDSDYFKVEYEYELGSMFMRDNLRMTPTPTNLERFRIGRPFTITID